MYETDYNWKLAQQTIDCRRILYELKNRSLESNTAENFSFNSILLFIIKNNCHSGYNVCRLAAMCRQLYRENNNV